MHFYLCVAKDAEVRAAVEHIERQLDVAKKSWAEYQERARVAEVKHQRCDLSTQTDIIVSRL